jgi:HlyD family secretion protein
MSFRRVVRWLLFFLLCTAAVYYGWQKFRPEPVKVTIASVSRGSVEKLVANTRAGTLKACREAGLSPAIGGQITSLPIKEGDRVEKGDLLVELWNKDMIARLELAGSEAAAATAAKEAIQRQYEEAERIYKRNRQLHKTSSISEEQFDKTETSARILAARYKAAQAQEQTSIDNLKLIRTQLEKTRLFAPFDGIVAEINGELNEYVTPSPPGIATPPTVILLDTSCFYVTAPIDEVDAPAIQTDMTARVTMDAFGERSFAARVRRIAPYVLDLEKQARTVEVEVDFVDIDKIKDLLAGYSADVEIILDVHHDTLWIPTQAILDDNRIFIFDHTSRRLFERKIETGLANWDRTEILSGLKEGESVVLSIDRPGVEDGAAAVMEE